jgi:hypothetical protein
LALFLLSQKNFNEAEHSKNVFCKCLWPRLKFLKRKSKNSGSRSWYQMKDLARRNTLVKYESPTTYQSKVMNKVNFLEKVKLQGQRSEGQGHGIKWKVLPEGIHMWNMKALPSTNQNLWPRLEFGKWSNSKVKHQKEYACEIWKPYHLPIKSYNQG